MFALLKKRNCYWRQFFYYSTVPPWNKRERRTRAPIDSVCSSPKPRTHTMAGFGLHGMGVFDLGLDEADWADDDATEWAMAMVLENDAVAVTRDQRGKPQPRVRLGSADGIHCSSARYACHAFVGGH